LPKLPATLALGAGPPGGVGDFLAALDWANVAPDAKTQTIAAAVNPNTAARSPATCASLMTMPLGLAAWHVNDADKRQSPMLATGG
jgi:hypothetical protein